MPLRTISILIVCLVAAAPAAADAPVRASSAGDRSEARETLREAKALLDGRGVETGKELTPVLAELATHLKALPEDERREATRIMARPTVGQAQAGEDAYSSNTTEHRICTAHFCVHWVTSPDPNDPDVPPLESTDGDDIPDFVQTMSQVFENVFAVENVAMGWREPTPDGTRGGDFNKVDVYLKQLGDQGIFGYATPDPGQQANSQAAYLVMDDDFSTAEYPRYSNPLPPMQVTAAHEYNHVLQFGYDVLQDTWMFESTAVWMEDKVYDDINDYVSYLGPWSQLTQVPLTAFNPGDLTDPLNVKVYGEHGLESLDRRALRPGHDPRRHGRSRSRRGRRRSLPTPTTRRCSRTRPRSSIRSRASRPTPPSGARRPACSRRAPPGPTSSARAAPPSRRARRAVEGRLDHGSFALLERRAHRRRADQADRLPPARHAGGLRARGPRGRRGHRHVGGRAEAPAHAAARPASSFSTRRASRASRPC